MSNVNLPKDAVLDETMLYDLCNRDWYRISFGSVAEWDVSIRYVLGENSFGYKPYGQFFFSEFTPEEYDFYVFDTNEMWEEDQCPASEVKKELQGRENDQLSNPADSQAGWG